MLFLLVVYFFFNFIPIIFYCVFPFYPNFTFTWFMIIFIIQFDCNARSWFPNTVFIFFVFIKNHKKVHSDSWEADSNPEPSSNLRAPSEHFRAPSEHPSSTLRAPFEHPPITPQPSSNLRALPSTSEHFLKSAWGVTETKRNWKQWKTKDFHGNLCVFWKSWFP